MKKDLRKLLAVFGIAAGFLTVTIGCNNNKQSGGNESTPSEDQGSSEEKSSYSVTLPSSVVGGTVEASSLSVEKGQSVTLTVIPNEHYILDSLKVNGEEVTVSDGEVVIENVTGDLEVAVKFVGVSVVVKFSCDGQTFENVSAVYDQVYGALPTPTVQAGYEFAGWYTQADGEGSLIEVSSIVTNANEHILYAHFTPKAYAVTFDAAGGVLETENLEVYYNSAYGALPIPKKEGSIFAGWVNAAGEAVTAETIHKVDENVSLTAKYATLQTNLKNNARLVDLPEVEDGTYAIDVAIKDGERDLTANHNISLKSSNEAVVVDGMNLKVADNADNVQAVISLVVDGVEVQSFNVLTVDYEGLGYVAVDTKDEFYAMTGTGKYVLTADINLGGSWMANTTDWVEYIDTLVAGAVIDGNGHLVSNGRIMGGWNRGWIHTLQGTVRNIGFTGIKSPDNNPFSTGLIGTLNCGGLIENVYLQIEVLKDGNSPVDERGGGLVGGFFDGTISNCFVDMTFAANVSAPTNTGIIVGKAGAWSGKVYNTYGICRVAGVNAYAGEAAEGVWAGQVQDGSGIIYNTVHNAATALGENKNYPYFIDFANEGVLYNGAVVSQMEEALRVEMDGKFAFTLGVPEYVDFSVYVYGSLTEEYTVSYESSDPNIFTIDEEGLVTPVSKGTAMLKLVVNKEKEMSIEVSVGSSYTVAIDNELTFIEGNETQIDFKVLQYGEEISTYDIKFASSNQELFTVTNTGLVTPLKAGEGKLTVTVYDEYTIEVPVKVNSADGFVYIYNANDWRTLITANPAGKYKLANNIDLAGGWATAGDSAVLANEFTGVLDGNGYSVSNAWMPGGWNKGLFTYNKGTIQNIAFINFYATNQVYDTALVSFNQGTMKNIYVDYILVTANGYGENGGVLAAYADGNSLIENCIVNLRKENADTVVPANQGAIFGRAQAWTGIVKNSYAITNDTGLTSIGYSEAASGIIQWQVETNGSNLFTTLGFLHANANLSEYDSAIWTITDKTIKLGHNTVYTVADTETTYIHNANQFRTLITANPAGKFKLACNIDLAGGFVTSSGSAVLAETFTGVLDGNGYSISNGWMPGGWNKGLFTYNNGTIQNIAFINIYATNQTYDTALVSFNRGTIKNVYVDYILVTANGYDGSAGVLASYADGDSLIENCIVNLRKENADTVVPVNQGAIFGRAQAWTGIVKNSYAITNDTGLTSIGYSEAASGIIQWQVETNGSNLFTTLAELYAGADLTNYDTSIWTVTETSIKLGHNTVLNLA